MTQLLISKVLEPQDIFDAYLKLFNAIQEKLELEKKMKDLDYEINAEIANATAQGFIDGKNAETRKAQAIEHTAPLQQKKLYLDMDILQIDYVIKLANIIIESHRQIIRYFSTVTE